MLRTRSNDAVTRRTGIVLRSNAAGANSSAIFLYLTTVASGASSLPQHHALYQHHHLRWIDMRMGTWANRNGPNDPLV
jgi:hypothetical protein